MRDYYNEYLNWVLVTVIEKRKQIQEVLKKKKEKRERELDLLTEAFGRIFFLKEVAAYSFKHSELRCP